MSQPFQHFDVLVSPRLVWVPLRRSVPVLLCHSWGLDCVHGFPNLMECLRELVASGLDHVGLVICQAPGLAEVRLDPFHRCDGRGGAVQEFVLNLDWWPVADLTVEPAMVEPVDIFGRRDLKVVDAPPGSFVAD